VETSRRYEIYSAQKGESWTPAQITRQRKKANRARRRYAEKTGMTYHLAKNQDGSKSGYTNYDLRNAD